MPQGDVGALGVAASLVLAVAVTVIEVGLILSVMAGGGPGSDTLARNTVFAALMITLNGIVVVGVNSQGGTLTANGRLRRQEIHSRLGALLDDLYRAELAS